MTTRHTVRLRPLELRHREKTRKWVNDPELMRLLNRERPVAQQEHEQWFAALKERKDCTYFAIETVADGIHVGNIWLWNIEPRHRRAEVRIVVGTDYTGKGVGTQAISRLCDYAFEQLELHKLYAYVLAFNPRARRAFEKAGFVLEGTLSEDRWTGEGFTDVYLFGKLRRREALKAQRL
ncbi:MAG TPA: GNAT family N-acetyltransferase [Pyrinomonadaceae bacterium]|nr:GNAT family N-acetyltransferase [Pyrinomonadaceae bacterium]